MDITKNYLICKKTLSIGVLKTVKSKGIQSLSIYSKKYGDDNWKLIQNKSEIVVHQQCNLHFYLQLIVSILILHVYFAKKAGLSLLVRNMLFLRI